MRDEFALNVRLRDTFIMQTRQIRHIRRRVHRPPWWLPLLLAHLLLGVLLLSGPGPAMRALLGVFGGLACWRAGSLHERYGFAYRWQQRYRS
jgi:hypothetical protein